MRTRVVTIFVCAVAACASLAHAAVTMTATEIGGDVVFEGSGTLNLDAMQVNYPQTRRDPIVDPGITEFLVGPVDAWVTAYVPIGGIFAWNERPIGGLGTGGETLATSGSGDMFGFLEFHHLTVPFEYVSGDPLEGTATYEGATFASLGLDVGTYVWSWGEDATLDSFTLEVTTNTPVEPSTWGKVKALYK
jgi:hypothetical protein